MPYHWGDAFKNRNSGVADASSSGFLTWRLDIRFSQLTDPEPFVGLRVLKTLPLLADAIHPCLTQAIGKLVHQLLDRHLHLRTEHKAREECARERPPVVGGSSQLRSGEKFRVSKSISGVVIHPNDLNGGLLTTTSSLR